MKWVVLFSQTGSEIVELCNKLGRKPDLIYTNNFENEIKYHPGICDLGIPILGKHLELMQYLRSLTTEDTIITLHGYLRIIPEDICNQFNILNGHPGNILLYPELKNKDPQIRAWEGKYPTIGSVVHKVTPELDCGEIIESVIIFNNCRSLEEMYGLLRECSLKSWVQVLSKYENLGCEIV